AELEEGGGGRGEAWPDAVVLSFVEDELDAGGLHGELEVAVVVAAAAAGGVDAQEAVVDVEGGGPEAVGLGGLGEVVASELAVAGDAAEAGGLRPGGVDRPLAAVDGGVGDLDAVVAGL